MTFNSELETKVIERFIIKSKRERYQSFIKSNKSREKFIKELAHFCDLRKDIFEEVIGNERQIIKDRIVSLEKINTCYLISESSELDQKSFEINKALEIVIGCGMGTLIIFGDAEIVYYEGEGPSNRWISKKVQFK